MPRSTMVVVKRCGTLEEAYLAKNLLESEGIDSDVLDEATANTAPYLLAYSGIRLSVADEDAERACQVLDLPRAEPSRPPKRGGLMVWFTVILGIAGLSIFFAGLRETPGKSAKTNSVEQDRNGDGKPDSRTLWDGANQPTQTFEDNNFDGVWDTVWQYRNNLIVSGETDPDFDGTFDQKLEFRNGVVAQSTITPGGKGNPLFRYQFTNGVLTVRWSDPDRDGQWNDRVDYDAMGRESAPQPVK